MAKVRQRRTREERKGAEISGRLERRARVMRAFTSQPPGTELDPDQVAAATHLPADLAKRICAVLEADRWLVRAGLNEQGHYSWHRATENGNDNSNPPTAQATTAPGAMRPGHRRFHCKACGTAVVAQDPPDGWLRLQVRDAEQERRNSKAFQTVAMVCGVGCLKTWAATTAKVSV